MADFKIAYDKTMGHEGRYANDPDDAGGETYMGISRRYHPHWDGWNIIDDKKGLGFPTNLAASKELDMEVMDFYEAIYWDVNLLDEVPSQSIANEMFDTGVNMGVSRATKFLQKSLNFLNRNGSLFEELIEDGDFGTKTLDAVKIILSHNDELVLLTMMNVLQGCHYMKYMKKSPVQEKYARGWFKRVILSKE